MPHHSCMVEECCDALKLPPAAVWVRPACSVISGRQTRAPGLPPAAPRNTVGALHTLSLCQAVSPLWGVPGKPPAVLSPKSAAPHPGADASGSTVPPTSQVTSLENTICSDPKTAAKAFLQALSAGGAQAQSAVYALVNAVGGRAAGQVVCPALAAGSPVKHALCRVQRGAQQACLAPSCTTPPAHGYTPPGGSTYPSAGPGPLEISPAPAALQDCSATSGGGSSSGGSPTGASTSGGSSGGGSTGGGSSGGGTSGGGSSSSSDPVDQTYKVRAAAVNLCATGQQR